jgi:hypothetical protein
MRSNVKLYITTISNAESILLVENAFHEMGQAK